MADPYVLFKIEGTHYAIPSAQVQQLEMIESITPVPNTPEYVDGVIYLRGQVIPVINLRRRFHLPPIPYDLSTRLIVVQSANRTLGLAVDSAREFVIIDPGQVQAPPESLSDPALAYIEGILPLNQRLVFLINLDQLIQASENAAPARR